MEDTLKKIQEVPSKMTLFSKCFKNTFIDLLNL